MSELKIKAARAALEYIDKDSKIIGVGSGSTVNFFIKELVHVKHCIDACVASSKTTELLLREMGVPVIDLNVADEVPIYIDGADEVNANREMIKGGGGALTREKIIATVAKQFICIVDDSKVVPHLGKFPIAVEVIPMARSLVAREVVKLGGDPHYREGFVTDNGNIILDVFYPYFNLPNQLEDVINRICGVVENGLFTKRLADHVLVASAKGVTTI
jgi:ribose 5-phosphate isomerase A